jgi:hypothetical protein
MRLIDFCAFPEPFPRAIHQHRLEPGSKTTLGIVSKPRHLFDKNDEDILHQIVSLIRREMKPVSPTVQQRSVQGYETVPGGVRLGLTQLFQETDRSGVHQSCPDRGLKLMGLC